MQQIQELAHVFIPASREQSEIYDISTYAQGIMHLKITIEAGASIILYDTVTHNLESLELTVEKGAQLFLVSRCYYKLISINCYEKSYFSCMQVLMSGLMHQDSQSFKLSMQETGSSAYVRIMPLLQQDTLECFTEQIHMSSGTSSDVQIIGSIQGAGYFGNKSKIFVPAGLQCVNIVQKTIMFLVHTQAKAYAIPCFDVASNDIRCTHGAAIGSLDENQLWYLQARGISCQDAMILLPRTRCIASLDPVMPNQAQKMVYAILDLQ
jgi:Fe-S cluster assembly protein SufD